MTLYCQSTDRLAPWQMARLAPGAKASHGIEYDPELRANVERYTYQWRDFQVNLYLTRRPHIARQVHSFLEYAAALAQAQGATLDQEFIRRVRSTRIIIGYDAGPNYLEHSRFQRLETILVALRDITGSLLHWEGAIYDQDGRLLIA